MWSMSVLFFFYLSIHSFPSINAAVHVMCLSEPTDSGSSSSRDESADNNNNSGDYVQQFKEWREMIIAATEGRERAEQEIMVSLN